MLADEPTASLDHDTAYRIMALMKRMRDEFGTSFVLLGGDRLTDFGEKQGDRRVELRLRYYF